MQLSEDTFLLYAAKWYDNPNCTSSDEFMEDLSRIKYVKKLFFTYKKKGVLRERLILNHLVVLYNIFEAKACTRMLFFKLEDYYECLAPFLMFMGYLPKKVDGVTDETIDTELITLDPIIIQRLRKIEREGHEDR